MKRVLFISSIALVGLVSPLGMAEQEQPVALTEFLEKESESSFDSASLLVLNDTGQQGRDDALALSALIGKSVLLEGSVIEEQERDLRSRIGVGFSFGFGAKVSLGSMETFTSSVGASTGGGMNRTYLDGFVSVDSSDNLGDVRVPSRTHNFGFEDSSQVDLVRNAGTIEFHDVRLSGGSALDSKRDGASPGFEIFYSRRLSKGQKWERELEIGLSFQDIGIRSGTGAANFEVLTDSYELGGVDPTVRGVPYTGGFLPDISGSPKIGDIPTRTLSTAQGTIIGGTDIDSTTLMGRLGPSFRYHASDKFRLNLLGGVALGYSSVDVRYNEVRSVSLGGSAIVSRRSGSFGDSDLVWGGYAAVRGSYYLTERLTALGEVRYLYTDSFELNDGVRSASIELSDGIGLMLGVGYDF
jgi:hypothetical protein